MANTRSATSTWGGDAVNCEVEMRGGYRVFVDEPTSVGGTDSGPQPTDLLLASVASCFTLSLIYSAKKFGLTLSQIEVEVTGTYDGPRYAALEVECRLGDLPEADKERLIRSAERVCYVSNTLRRTPEITVNAR